MKYISIPHYFLAVIILAVPVRAISQEFNYDFIEGTYSSLTVETGTIFEFGYRHMATDTVELAVVFSRTDIFDDTSNQIGFGLRFYSDEKLSLGVGYATGDDVDALLFNVRIAMNQ